MHRPCPVPPNPGTRTDWDAGVRVFLATYAALDDPVAMLRGGAGSRDAANAALGSPDSAGDTRILAQAFPLPGFAPSPLPGEPSDDATDEAARVLSNAITRKLRGVFANEGTEEARSPGDILSPGGVPIGTPNRNNPKIRNLPGGTKAAEEMFEKLSKGGTPTTKSSYKGRGIDLPGGGFVGYRPKSSSGPSAIDVNIPGSETRKLHFP